MKDEDKIIPIILFDLARINANKIPKEAVKESNLSRKYGLNVSQSKFNRLCKFFIIKGFLSDNSPTDVGLDKDKIRLDKIRLENIQETQIKNLLISFEKVGLKSQVQAYLDLSASLNKSKKISPRRQLTILLELDGSLQRCSDGVMFKYALEGSLSYKAPNIGYLNAIIKNKRIKVTEK